MFEIGLIEEVQELIKLGLKEGKTAQAAIGYSQTIKYLDGQFTLAQAIESTTIATRQYSRRQITWFGRDRRITWIPEMSSEERVTKIIEKLNLEL